MNFSVSVTVEHSDNWTGAAFGATRQADTSSHGRTAAKFGKQFRLMLAHLFHHRRSGFSRRDY
jgi:hypothetical protein